VDVLERELRKLIAERDSRRKLFRYQEAVNRSDGAEQEGRWQIIEREIYSEIRGDFSRHMRSSPVRCSRKVSSSGPPTHPRVRLL